MHRPPHQPTNDDQTPEASDELAPLLGKPEDNRKIRVASDLHPNQLAQLDAAFRRHHWLVSDTGVGELLDRHCRSSNRGRRKQGLDGCLYYALQLTAVFAFGQATIEQMYVVSRSLPLKTRLDFGLVSYEGKKKVGELTRKQLYTMTEGLARNLNYTADCLTKAETELPVDEQAGIVTARRAERHAVVNDIVSRLLTGTHLIDVDHGTYAIDDTSIWAWSKAPYEDRNAAGGKDRPLADEDSDDQQEPLGAVDNPSEEGAGTGADTGADTEGRSDGDRRRNPDSWRCPDAAWGGKTSKTGKQVGIYGYKAHVIVNTNDPERQTALPVLIQALELTPANADIVDVSLRLIDQIRDRAPFVRIIGDRHYGYKRFERWALELWMRRIHQVLDLRVDKPGPVDQFGAKVIDGRPHCPGMAAHLENLSPSDDPDQQAQFVRQVEYRQKFAFRMVAGPLASQSKVAAGQPDPKVGTTRWECPALAGTVGCPLRQGTVQVARELDIPIVPNPPTPGPDGSLPKCCVQRTVQINPDSSMKYLQEDYWGGTRWSGMFDLRSAVEAVFGNIKNRGTEDVRRGFVQVTGLPLVTLGVAAAAACYNIRILEKHSRESGQRIGHPLMNHPLDSELIESVLLRGEEVTDYAASHTAAA
ncbi:transposase [Nocardioides pakistanensis]